LNTLTIREGEVADKEQVARFKQGDPVKAGPSGIQPTNKGKNIFGKTKNKPAQGAYYITAID
jgi:hypothetical protein